MILGVIGCGKMAQAILTGIHKQETCPYSVLLVNDIDGNRVRLFANLFRPPAATKGIWSDSQIW